MRLILIISFYLAVTFHLFSQNFTLDKNQFQVQKTNEAILTIKEYGYYSISTVSNYGASFQIVDNMSGLSKISGISGEKDGRTDILLEEGKYKIRIYSIEKGEGNIKLNVYQFKEKNLPQSPVLNINTSIENELNDLEQISYWIEIKDEQEKIFIEGYGRNLKKISIWKDGNWLIDEKINEDVFEYKEGNPLNNLSFFGTLKKGFYKFSFYGGEKVKWSTDDNKNPLFIKYGVSLISPNSRFMDMISSCGRNRYLVEANYFLLQTKDKDNYKLKINYFNNDNPNTYSQITEINKNSRRQECKINLDNFYLNYYLMTVEGTPNKTVTIQTMAKNDLNIYINEGNGGNYWFSTIHSGFIEDSIEPSGFISYIDKDYTIREKKLKLLNGKTGWQDTFNLIEEISFLFEVEEDGNYQVETTGVEAEFKLEKLLVGYKKDYNFSYKKGKQNFNLIKGIYQLTINPVKMGIVTATIKKDSLLNFIFGNPDIKKDNVRGNLQFPSIYLGGGCSYKIFINNQGRDINQGYILRKLPLDLKEPLPVILTPNEEIETQIYIDEDSLISVKAFNDKKYIIKINNKEISQNDIIKKGNYNISIKNLDKTTESYNLKSIPLSIAQNQKLQYFSNANNQSLPKFDSLETDNPVFLNLKKNEQKIFLLDIKKSGVYTIQTKGRLQTKGTIRTKIRTNLFSKQTNGIGRNFFLQEYLKEGIYQLIVETIGESTGHLSIMAKYKAPIDGGKLVEGRTVKNELFPEESIRYKFDIIEDGNYSIETKRLVGGMFNFRLEDADGWLLENPKTPIGNYYFAKGSYQIFYLPLNVWGRKLTTLKRILPEIKFDNKGPYDVEINKTYSNQWLESTINNERQGDIYNLNIPSKINAQISFSQEMYCNLYYISNNDKIKIETIYPEKFYNGILQKGKYILEFFSKRIDNYFDYNFGIATSELVDGLSYNITVPSSIRISVEENSLVELFSTGNADVYAELYSQDNKLLTISDDSYNDWNFKISQYLKSGNYLLKVKSRDGTKNWTSVSMNVIKNKNKGSLDIPFKETVKIDNEILIYDIPQKNGFISIDINSNSLLGASINQSKGTEIIEIAKKEGKNINLCLYNSKDKNIKLSIWRLNDVDDSFSINIEEKDIKKSNFSDIFDKYKEFNSKELQSSILSFENKDNNTYKLEILDENNQYLNLSQINYGMQVKYGDFTILDNLLKEEVTLNKGSFLLKLDTKNTVKIKLSNTEMKEEKYINTVKNEPYLININNNDGIDVIKTFSDKIIPLCGFVTENNADNFLLDGNINVTSNASIKENSSLSISFSNAKNKCAVWNPDSFDTNSNVLVTNKHFVASKQINILTDYEDFLVENDFKTFSLTKGQKILTVSLDANMALFTYTDKNILEIFHTNALAEDINFITNGENLGIIGYGKTDGCYKVQLKQIGNPITNNENILIENYFNDKKTFTIPINKNLQSKYQYVNMLGNVNIKLINNRGIYEDIDQGKIKLNNNFSILNLNLNAGFVKIWLSKEKTENIDRWGTINSNNSKKIDINTEVSISGNVNWFQISVKDETIINLNSNTNFTLCVQKDGNVIETKEVLDNNHCFYANKGEYLFGVRPIYASYNNLNFDNYSTMSLNFQAINPIDIASQKISNYLLNNKEIKGFVFDVKQDEQFFVGYSSNNDMLESFLYNSKFELIKKGSMIFTNLTQGRYYIIYKIKGDIPLIKFKPVIIGNKSIEKEILDQKIKDFLINNGFM
ncbi:MAG: hypothetical protein A2086_03955 [Spirochaetes bacterium GWD1_27_9]|nr:MAG: hypothetical protein A2Z98_01540 [Spirochaetes bacterium GWB1_27_13]OHD25640.1 MAG: hypothetical protein A2Y34_07845 [Spirochaetes bacterium GWC1_27_15]OHD36167.1 MAG: hypothetical protein A2086_03955 [Spirochaetes bacterium GWD1_27_9]